MAFEAPTDVTQPGVPLEHWWTAYNDPQLESLIALALVKVPGWGWGSASFLGLLLAAVACAAAMVAGAV